MAKITKAHPVFNETVLLPTDRSCRKGLQSDQALSHKESVGILPRAPIPTKGSLATGELMSDEIIPSCTHFFLESHQMFTYSRRRNSTGCEMSMIRENASPANSFIRVRTVISSWSVCILIALQRFLASSSTNCRHFHCALAASILILTCYSIKLAHLYIVAKKSHRISYVGLL